nr:DUF2586 family protein [Escherichia coli]
MSFKHELGQVVEVSISGEEGHIKARAEYTNSCNQYLIHYQTADGRASDAWFEEGEIADRSLNSTPGSIAAHQTLFARPLREMSTAASINGVSFPGEVKPPQDGDVTIVWKNKKAVDIYIVVRTYEVPLQITISLLLDASLEASA